MISDLPLIHTILTEAVQNKKGSLSIDDAALLVSQECKQALHAAPLWYSSSSRIEAFASHPKQNRTGSHLVTLIDYALPNWKDYPAYSNSFSLTSKPIFNIAHRAFPIDGAQLVLAPSLYFGSSFKHAFEKIRLNGITFFDSIFNTIHSIFNAWSKRKEGKGIGANLTSNQIETFLVNAQQLLDNWQNHELMIARALEQIDQPDDVRGKAKAALLQIIKIGEGDITRGLNRVLDPEINGFQLTTIANFKQPHNGEIWTDAACVMVSNDVLGNME